MKSYKNREVDLKKPVEVYRCLHRKGHVFSIRQGGQVKAHTETITLSSVEMVVSEKGRCRVLKEQRRNVHAFLRGYICEGGEDTLEELKYNPYSNPYFHCNGKRVDKSEMVKIDETGVYVKLC